MARVTDQILRAGQPTLGVPARWWHELADGRLQCDLCPRECRLRDGQRAYCFVRERAGDQIVLTTYGRSSGFALDPIEKKPLWHFYPGSTVLSFGTAGCNLGCRYCQNWDISAAKDRDRLGAEATPKQIAQMALEIGAKSVAFTYNDPVIFAEYAIDAARAARAMGVHPVAVTAGYIHSEPRAEFFGEMAAANIDLKAFTEEFYWRLTGGHLQTVLDTLVYVRHETDCWLEITNLVIPGFNDAPDQITAMCEWIVKELGGGVPVHFSAFHPDFKMRQVPRTPFATLAAARRIALDVGLEYVYLGNVPQSLGETTECPGCGAALITRLGYRVVRNRIVVGQNGKGTCPQCAEQIPGRY